MKSIDTLIKDIQILIEEGHVASQKNVDDLGRAIATTVKKRLQEAADPPREHKLYMSGIGKPDRQVWFDAHFQGTPEKLDASARLKFMFGDVLEHVLIFLARESGHEVTDEQKRIVIDDVSGRMDCKIDGVVVDTKSASTFAFNKFKDGSLARKDDFGYMWQLSGYSWAEDHQDGAFFVIDKQLGHLALDKHSKEELKLYNVPERIEELKKIVALPNPPGFCADEIPEGKSGNMRIPNAPCGYCRHREECRPGLKMYLYSSGPKWFTKVVKEPRVGKDDE